MEQLIRSNMEYNPSKQKSQDEAKLSRIFEMFTNSGNRLQIG